MKCSSLHQIMSCTPRSIISTVSNSTMKFIKIVLHKNWRNPGGEPWFASLLRMNICDYTWTRKTMPQNYPHANQWSLMHTLILMEIVMIQNIRGVLMCHLLHYVSRLNNIQNVAIIDATLQVSLCTQVNHIHF